MLAKKYGCFTEKSPVFFIENTYALDEKHPCFLEQLPSNEKPFS